MFLKTSLESFMKKKKNDVGMSASCGWKKQTLKMLTQQYRKMSQKIPKLEIIFGYFLSKKVD